MWVHSYLSESDFKLTHFIIEVDNPLKNGLFWPSFSRTYILSCLLSWHNPLNVNFVFFVLNSHTVHTRLNTKIDIITIKIFEDNYDHFYHLGLWSEHWAEPHFPEFPPLRVNKKTQFVLPSPCPSLKFEYVILSCLSKS